ncbi:MFS transporter [Bradyrhizobium sp. Arg314]
MRRHDASQAANKLARDSPSERTFFLTVLLSSTILVSVSDGLVMVTIPLALWKTVNSVPEIGFVLGAYSAGFFLGCILLPRLVAQLGHVRSAILCLLLLITITSGFSLIEPSALSWSIIRGVGGCSTAGLYIILESLAADNLGRSRQASTIAAYATLRKIGFISGQLIGAGLLLGQDHNFSVAIAVYALGAMPLAFAARSEPPLPDHGAVPSVTVIRRSSTGMIGAFIAGTTGGSVLSLLPIWGLAANYSSAEATFFAVAFQIGGVALQPVGGFVSERLRNRTFTRLLALVIAAASVTLFFETEALAFLAVATLVAILGGCNSVLYSLALGQATSVVKRSEILAVAGNVMIVWSAGALVGALAGSLTLDIVGPNGLFAYVFGWAILLMLSSIARKEQF